MNIEFYELIGKSIDCLSTAKTDIINRKSLILEATRYIKRSIDKFAKEDPILNINLMDLVKYNISNNNTNGIETTKGINQLLLENITKEYKSNNKNIWDFKEYQKINNEKIYGFSWIFTKYLNWIKSNS